MKFKYELAHLFFRLKESNFIRPINTKGYFNFVERYVTDRNGKKLRKNSLKKISSKITIEPDKYPDVIKNVNEIMSILSV